MRSLRSISIPRAVPLLLALLVAIPESSAQSLGEVAARERRKREAAGKASEQAKEANEDAAAADTAAATAGVGFRLADLSTAFRIAHGMPTDLRGALVKAVFRGGPAARAGLRKDDVVVEVGGQPTRSNAGLGRALDGHVPGQTLPMTVWRSGQRLPLTVTLGRKGEYLRRSCEAGDAEACADVVSLGLVTGAEARALAEKACAGGAGDACVEVGKRIARGHAAPPPEAFAAWVKACEVGAPFACYFLGQTYDDNGASPDPVRMEAYYRKACDGGAAGACFDLAFNYEDGLGVPKDLDRARELYADACDAERLDACVNLGLMYLQGKGMPKDEARARAILEPACSAGMPRACAILARQDLKNPAGPAPLAVTSLQTSCEAGDVVGCLTLGEAYERGKGGVPRDPARAAALYDTGCRRGYGAACFNLGFLCQAGQGVPKDGARAAALYVQACELKHLDGCWAAGVLYAEGDGVPRDEARAKSLLQRSCAAGNSEACGWLKKVESKP